LWDAQEEDTLPQQEYNRRAVTGGKIARVSPSTDVGAKLYSAVFWSGLGSQGSST